MAMFLMILFTSVPVLVLCAILFAGTSRRNGEEKLPEFQPGARASLAPPRFFADESVRPSAQTTYPVEVLLSQIERHIRLEQAAAESFLDVPTRESLHSRTATPLMN